MLRCRLVGYLAVAALMLAASVLTTKVFSSVEIKDDIPIICEACSYDCIVEVLADTVYPGHMATVPINIYVDTNIVIDYVKVKLTTETGLSYYALDTTDWDWHGDLDTSFVGSTIEIEFIESTLDGGASGSEFHLLNLVLQAADTVEFSNNKSITHQANTPIVSDTTTEATCDPDAVDGWVTIPAGDCWFWADTTIGYSYQARDTGDTEKDTLIWVPILFKATFPVDSLKIGVWLPYDLELCYDSFEAGEESNAVFERFGPIYAWTLTDYESLYDPDTEVVLGWLKFKGADYRSNYNSNFGFTELDTLYFWGSSFTKVHCDSSEQELTWGDVNVTTGGIEYPVYSCSTSIGSDTVGLDLSVTLPVRANHTFWSQRYDYFISFNNRCLELDTVTVPSGVHVQLVDYDEEDISGDTTTYRVETESMADSARYVFPNSNEIIFNLGFIASDSFADNHNNSTTVWVNTADFDNEVHDYFHVSGSKVERESDSTAYFYVSSGTVDVPVFFAVAIDTVSGCDTSEVTSDYTVPVRVTRVTQNSVDSIWFKILCPDTQYIEITDFSTGDFSFNSTSYKITKSGDAIYVNLGMDRGTIDTEGVVCYLTCDINSPVSGFAELNFDYFFMQWFHGSGFPSHRFDGGIDECGGGGKREPPKLPLAYTLNQNYPNPFNASTVIRYSLLQASDVRIDIFDILGRKVETLVQGEQPAGYHQVTWDAKGQSSGMYFYLIQSGEYRDSKKMLLLR